MSIEEKFIFTLEHYTHCIQASLEKNYIFHKMSNIDNIINEDKTIILRHDIDTQLDIAVKMAEIESNLHVSSTFFVRLHSHSYNPLCIKDARKIQKIASLGHEIGLHYEPDYYSLISKSFNDFIKSEMFFLSAICGNDIKCIAPHEPTRTGIKNIDNNLAKDLGIITQAYDDVLLSKFKYLSDSNCNWREGSWFYHLNRDSYRKMYILTHPYWWYDNSPIENY